jgi:dolichol kinase
MTMDAPPAATPELDSLVARTTGPQPWRKIFHACNAVAVCAFVVIVDPSQTVLLAVLTAVVAVLVVGDLVRLRSASLNALFFRTFRLLASPREARAIASSTWYAIGILASFALFPRAIAVSSVLVLGLGDPTAAFVGRRFGRRKFLGGTVAGTAACFGVAAVVLLLRHPAPAALLAAAASALAERRSWPLDDNQGLPMACGGAITLVTWIA